MDKERFLENKLKEFGKRLDVKLPLEIYAERNTEGLIGCVDYYIYTDTKEPFYLVKYNRKLLKKSTKKELLYFILHEIGHVLLEHLEIPKREMTNSRLLICEIFAKLYALEIMKLWKI